MKITLHDWAEWKRRCSVAGCPEATRRRIGRYLQQLVRRFFEKNSTVPGLFLSDMDEGSHHQAMGLFDSWMLMGSDGTKPQKDWLVRRCAMAGRNPQKILGYYNSNVFCLCRAAVEDYLRKEGCLREKVSTIQADSLSAPTMGKDGREYVLGDRLAQDREPLPDQVATEADLRKRAKSAGATLWESLTLRERLLLFAHSRGLSLNTPRLFEVAGVKSAALYERSQKVLEKVKAFCQESLPEKMPAPTFLWERLLTLVLIQRMEDWAGQTPEIQAIWGPSDPGERP